MSPRNQGTNSSENHYLKCGEQIVLNKGTKSYTYENKNCPHMEQKFVEIIFQNKNKKYFYIKGTNIYTSWNKK
jgi:hypothetical protein